MESSVPPCGAEIVLEFSPAGADPFFSGFVPRLRRGTEIPDLDSRVLAQRGEHSLQLAAKLQGNHSVQLQELDLVLLQGQAPGRLVHETGGIDDQGPGLESGTFLLEALEAGEECETAAGRIFKAHEESPERWGRFLSAFFRKSQVQGGGQAQGGLADIPVEPGCRPGLFGEPAGEHAGKGALAAVRGSQEQDGPRGRDRIQLLAERIRCESLILVHGSPFLFNS